MKSLGGFSGGGTDGVLNLVSGKAELLSNNIDGFTSPEQVDHIV
jgi:hypothetical protein